MINYYGQSMGRETFKSYKIGISSEDFGFFFENSSEFFNSLDFRILAHTHQKCK